jgi:kynurenine 3-monooxygenase
MGVGTGQRVLIVGGGLTGPLLAIYLARLGYTVRVADRRSDPRKAGYSGGRSINLALSARGLWGLAGVGLDGEVMARDAIPMPGRMIHTLARPGVAAEPVFQPYSADPRDAIHAVSRGGLNLTLLNAAEREPGVELLFDLPCVDVDLDAPGGPEAVFASSGGERRERADLIVGADGAYSAVRLRLMRTDRFEYSQSYLSHGYKELSIPSAAELGMTGHDGYAMPPNALHIWPRGGAMMIALPNRDRTFTCTLFWPFRDGGGHSLEGRLESDGQIRSFFRAQYPDAEPLMPALCEEYRRNPNGSLVTVRCRPWAWRDRVVLVGDAAHAIVPFYGQGMNCGFEDCRVLAECLARHGGCAAEALQEYERLRKPNADAIAEMALENFVEMRDKVADPAFRYRKRVEQALHSMLPERVHPQYNLVSFSTVPYTEARRRGRELEAVLDRVIRQVPMGSEARLGEEGWRAALRQAFEESSERESDATGTDGVIDITPMVTERLGVWPGDTPLSRQVLCDIEKGDTVTLSTIRATVHLGAHADGPNHYGAGAPGIGERNPRHYLGPCRVLDAPVARRSRVKPQDVRGLDELREARVLIRTGTFPDPECWNDDFAGLSVELVEALARRGVITIGIDTPSVDLQDSKDLPAHRAILRHDMAILEGLMLAGVEPGAYELIALPLRLMGFDASPVRAVLRPIEPSSAKRPS